VGLGFGVYILGLVDIYIYKQKEKDLCVILSPHGNID